jgi:hypothetical protein
VLTVAAVVTVLTVAAELAVRIVVPAARTVTRMTAGDRRMLLPGPGVPHPANSVLDAPVTKTQEAVILTSRTLTTTENSNMAVNAVSLA